jgi:hypothetical protein
MRRRRAAKRQRLVAFALRRSLFRMLLIVGVTCIPTLLFPNALVTSAEPLQRVRRSELYNRKAVESVGGGTSDGGKEIADQLTDPNGSESSSMTQNATIESWNETHLSTYWLEEGETEKHLYESASDQKASEEESTNATVSTQSGEDNVTHPYGQTSGVTETEPEFDGNAPLKEMSASEEATENGAANDTGNRTESEGGVESTIGSENSTTGSKTETNATTSIDSAVELARESTSNSMEVKAPQWQDPDPVVMDPYWLSQPEEGQIMKPLWDESSEDEATSKATQDLVKPLQTGGDSVEMVYNTYSPSSAYGASSEGGYPNGGSKSNAGDSNGNDLSSGGASGEQLIQPPWTRNPITNQVIPPPLLVQDESQSLTAPVWLIEESDSEELPRPNYYSSSGGSSSSGSGSSGSFATSTYNQGNQGLDVMTPPWVPQETNPSMDSLDQFLENDGYVGINQPYYDPSASSSGFEEAQWTESTEGTGTDQMTMPTTKGSGSFDTTGETQSIIDPVWSEGTPQDQAGRPSYFTRDPNINFQTVPRQGPSIPGVETNEGDVGTTEDQVGGTTNSGQASGSGYHVTGVTYGQLPDLPSWLESMSFPPVGGKGSKGKGCSESYQPSSSKSSKVKKKGKCNGNQRK